ncbi:MAG: hypothetical protein DRP74_01230 [Candidatus Omnitrophota bacterium]|nr:MAG: hypothetical protein DRP74_01230 [Candidatus Omnitrophota bacterium]
MSRILSIDYLGYILLKLFGPLFRRIPVNFTFFLGRRIGELFFLFDYKHRAVAYSNLKTALGNDLSPCQIRKITRQFYRVFGQNLMEIFLMPLIDKDYTNKYVEIEGLEHVKEALSRGKGVFILAVHAGSWELAGILLACQGIDFTTFVRGQRNPYLNRILNEYRQLKGCRVIERDAGLKELIRTIKAGGLVGISIDQGGKSGLPVDFFGKDASMGQGAVKLALNYGCALIPSYSFRRSGPYIKIIFGPAYQMKKTGNSENDIRLNLQNIIRIFEGYIRSYPQEYLWTYKIWKYSKERNILVLNDGKAGHLRQSQAVSVILEEALKEKDFKANTDYLEVKFKNNFSRRALSLSSALSARFQCQGCLACLRFFLKEDVYKNLSALKPDIIVSCGSSLAGLNYILSRENLAKSIVIMRPSFLSFRRFDAVILPRHDRPPNRGPVIATQGALNLINDDYLLSQASLIKKEINLSKKLVLGILIGGDTKKFSLNPNLIKQLFSKIKLFLERYDGEVLITTSRRTSKEIEELVKKEFSGYSRCKLLVIANEKNLAYAVGGILALSEIIIVSAESISMISEAVKSKKYILVLKVLGLSEKHRRFLEHFSKNKYIYLSDLDRISTLLKELHVNRPPIYQPDDRSLVKEALKKIL